ncbi:MAG: hypothetical protein IT386_14380, partial [Deltaproteobacteria bacterium]|nr:hypothetical protein [Deltaproteobacteria bacterium]
MPAEPLPLRPLPPRPRVLALEWNLPFHVDVAVLVAERHGWDFVYWVGDGPAFGRLVEARFPGIVFHDTVDARLGRPPAVLADLVPRPFDEAMAEALAYEQTLALKMMDRIELEESFSYHDRVRLFHRLAAWWSALLDRFEPDVAIFPTAPHVHYDYVAYALCRRRGIRTAMFENGSIPGLLLSTPRFEEGFPDLVATYRDLLASASDGDAVLSERVQKYLDRTRGGYVFPRDVGRVSEAPPAQETTTAARRPRWSDLVKLGRLDRYPEYLRRVVRRSEPRDPAPRPTGRRIAGHYHGRFLVVGEASDEEEARHAIWVSQRLAELRAEYEGRVTPAELSAPYVYLPLHVQPERSTAPNGGIYDHCELMIEAVARLVPSDWLVLVKEHPSLFRPWQVGERGRRLSDYARMAALSNVRLIPLETNPFALVDGARAVATVTVTTGWEAIARGVPVLCFGTAWYQGCDGVFDARRLEGLRVGIEAIVSGARPDERKVRWF